MRRPPRQCARPSAVAALVVAAIALVGCGRIGFGFSAGTNGDAGVDTTPGDTAPLGPFSNLQPVDELDTNQVEDDFTLSPDMLEIYFTRAPGTTVDGELFYASRATTSDAFSTPVPIAELNTAGHDGSPHISADGLTLIYTTEPAPDSGNFELWQATRASRLDPWSNPTPLTELNSNLADQQAKVDDTGLRIAFVTSSTSISLSTADLWEASRPTTSSAWSAPVEIAELNTSSGDLGPCYLDGGLTMYFYSNRATDGNIDIYRTTRPALDQPFGAVEHLPELSTSGREEDPWVSPDGRTIFFTRDNAIWRATR